MGPLRQWINEAERFTLLNKVPLGKFNRVNFEPVNAYLLWKRGHPFGYPLHPPGKKNKLKDAHLIKVPLLFFEGTRDPLCDLKLLRNVLGRLPVSWQLEIIDGGNHSFRLPKSVDVKEEIVHERILQKTINWLGGLGDGVLPALDK